MSFLLYESSKCSLRHQLLIRSNERIVSKVQFNGRILQNHYNLPYGILSDTKMKPEHNDQCVLSDIYLFASGTWHDRCLFLVSN